MNQISSNSSKNLNISEEMLSKSSSHAVCRICRCADSSLTSLKCNCQGTMGFVHNNCLIKWTRMTGTDICEICKGRYHCHKREYRQMTMAFFRGPYLSPILRKLITSLLIVPLVYSNTKEMIVMSNSPIQSLGIYFDTFMSPVMTFKVILFYEFTAWTSKMFRDIRMILGQWWISNEFATMEVTSAESSFESVQLRFVDFVEGGFESF